MPDALLAGRVCDYGYADDGSCDGVYDETGNCDQCGRPPVMDAAATPPLITGRHVHVYSVFGRWCYRCGHPKHWWALWEKWIEEEHDEPF